MSPGKWWESSELVGLYYGYGAATEWSHGQVTNLGGLPNSISNVAYAINNAGQVVGLERSRRRRVRH